MKLNAHLALADQRVVLVPYRPAHVPTYHAWMQDPDLRALTASEPLSLAEEHHMQQKWQTDEDKLTFIILARPAPSTSPSTPTPAEIASLPMVGDVNLFLKGAPADDDFEAELEVMIAEPAYRRRGLAHRALSLLLAFVTAPPSLPPSSAASSSSPPPNSTTPSPFPIPPHALVARIGASNAPSIALFRALGFEVVRTVEVFQEVEMRVRAGDEEEVGERWKGGEVVVFE